MRCLIDIVGEILKCASHLNNILFAFVVCKICTSFYSSYFVFYQKTPYDAVEAARERNERDENPLQTP